ncbi:MAG: hypothetical protein ACD_8C00057G0006 [uncultured bacterium]|nr:MAG: hypothetical protein ACD_8C00057G0006 [uncultured bacterium]
MRIFIDFDDVIFNTKKFKDDFEKLFVAHGISEDIFREHYYDPADNGKIKIFDADLHAKRIQDATGIDTSNIVNDLDEFLRDISKYVFPDVLKFFNDVGKDNVFVVSFGGIDFLKRKIEGSGISNHVKNIKVIDYEKSKAIAELMEDSNVVANEKLFFLDDRIEQIRDVKEKFPDIISILIKRPEGRYQEMCKEACCNLEAHNLKEAQKIIEKHDFEI